jgi:arylsulfatase
MGRRSIFWASLATITWLNISFLSGEKIKKPNIIVILADDMGYSDLSCMGSEIPTPNIDRLAKNGVLFTHFYNASRCCPSRASLLTGLYQTRAGMGNMNTTHLNVPEYQGSLSRNAVTIAEVLKESGYRTMMTGKWHVGDEPESWPNQRGFEKFYGIPAGGGLYFYPTKFLDRPVYLNEKEVIPESGWYSTDGFTDYAIRFIEEVGKEEKPFFLYQAYIAPHYPLQAKDEDIAKYKGKYDEGFESIRQKRFKRQKEMGIVSPETVLSPAEYPGWSSVENKMEESRKMEVYAAQIDCLDQNIGRLVQSLKDQGLYENTVIIFLSDNGACAEEVNKTKGVQIGGANSFVSYGKNWANVSSTPYRLFKHFNHEGGILTPMIVSWPKGISKTGVITDQPALINDIMPTCLELAGAKYPANYKGKNIFPVDGNSFWPLVSGEKHISDRSMFFQHEGNGAIRQNNWKLVMQFNKGWELYDMTKDPSEMNDLSKKDSIQKQQLFEKYQNWSRVYGVLPWPLPSVKKISTKQ